MMQQTTVRECHKIACLTSICSKDCAKDIHVFKAPVQLAHQEFYNGRRARQIDLLT